LVDIVQASSIDDMVEGYRMDFCSGCNVTIDDHDFGLDQHTLCSS